MYWLLCFLLGFIIAEIATLVTTLYLHRGSTHSAIKFNSPIEFLFQVCLWLTTGIIRHEWVAVHLYHHAHADKKGDPHSPLIEGLWKIQLFNVFYYWRAARKPEVLYYGWHIRPVGFEKIIYKIWGSSIIGLIVGIGIGCLVFGLKTGLIVAAIHTFLYMFFLNNLINGWCHARGYKNFPNNVGFNNRAIAMITMGEGLHNNHHGKPGSAKLSVLTSEFDPGYFFVKFLVKRGWAHFAS